MMRHGGRFCAVCMEQMVRSFFRSVHPIEDQLPNRVNVVVCAGEKREFTVRTLEYTAPRQEEPARTAWRWYVDGKLAKPKRTGNAISCYELDADGLGVGDHEVVVTCDLLDTDVRRDLGMMSDARFWRAEVVPYPRPTVVAPEKEVASVAKELSFQVAAKDLASGDFTLTCVGLPKGAAFDPVAGTVTWTPGEKDRGAYLVGFVAANGKQEERVNTLIVVRKAGANRPPEFAGVVDENGFEAEPFDFTLHASDRDGDALVYDMRNLPDGAELDRRSGTLRWRPGYLDSCKYYVVARVFDGVTTATAKLILTVEHRAIPYDAIEDIFASKRGMRFDYVLPLRAQSASHRVRACEQLCNTPVAFRAAHAARLLRDRDSAVRDAALALVRQEREKGEFLGCFFCEMADKVWQLTDENETLALLEEIVPQSKEREWPGVVRAAIARVDRDLQRAQNYNRRRAELREKEERKRAKEDKGEW